jgi:hypothetical protein
MKCQVCQNDLSAGSTFCTNCGTPVPSNPYGSSSSSPNQGIAPTMLASSSTPSDPYAPPPAAPYTPPANPYGTPSTDYGAATPPPANPYGASTPPPANPYGAPPASPYGVPPANPYGTPSSPGYNPAPGGFGAPGVPYGQAPYMPQQPKKRMNGCVMAIIIVASIFILLVAGLITAGVVLANKAGTAITNINATTTADIGTVNADLTPTTGSDGSTPTTSTSGSVPSSSQIDPTAQANITGAQTSHGVDANYKPTDVTSTFTSGQTVDIAVTFSGTAGYAMVKVYLNGSFDTKSDSPLTVKSGYATGDFPFTSVNTGNFVAGVYWCQQSDCSDAALAQVVSFTIS